MNQCRRDLTTPTNEGGGRRGGTATKLLVLDFGVDLTWLLLLKPGRSIRPRAERDKPVEQYPCTTHAVVVETPEGTML